MTTTAANALTGCAVKLSTMLSENYFNKTHLVLRSVQE